MTQLRSLWVRDQPSPTGDTTLQHHSKWTHVNGAHCVDRNAARTNPRDPKNVGIVQIRMDKKKVTTITKQAHTEDHWVFMEPLQEISVATTKDCGFRETMPYSKSWMPNSHPAGVIGQRQLYWATALLWLPSRSVVLVLSAAPHLVHALKKIGRVDQTKWRIQMNITESKKFQDHIWWCKFFYILLKISWYVDFLWPSYFPSGQLTSNLQRVDRGNPHRQ